MTLNNPVRKRSRLAGRIGPMVLLSLFVLILGWSILWLFARHEAHARFDVWLEAERTRGRLWTCPNMAIGGYPLDIVLSCDHPTFAGAGERGLHGDLAGLAADAPLYVPTNITVSLTGPLTVSKSDTTPGARVTWSAARLILRGTAPGDLDRGEIEADQLGFTVNGIAEPWRVAHVDVGFKPTPRAGTKPFDAETTFALTDAQVPEADAVFGSADPISAKGNAVITGLSIVGGGTLAALIEPWRQAGGQVHVKSFAFTKGAFQAAGEGWGALDDAHRLEGQIDARFTGLEPIAKRFGIPLGAVQLGGLLSSILGGKPAKADAPTSDLALPVAASNGRLFIGPVKTGLMLTPVY